jgi:hypothetical protein
MKVLPRRTPSGKRPHAGRIARTTAGPQGKPSKAHRVGPWLREDYRGFKRLCNDALRLEPPKHPQLTGPLWDAITQWHRDNPQESGYRENPYADIAAAQEALRNHAVYRWLDNNLRHAVDTAGDETPFVLFRRVRTVVESVPRIGPPPKPARMDKYRKTVANAVERLQESIDSGVLWFPNPAREEMLEQLLAEAKQILRGTQRRPASVKYPSLEWLAHDLYEQTGAADWRLLLEVAAVRNLDCDERTAQRYVEKARRARAAADR